MFGQDIPWQDKTKCLCVFIDKQFTNRQAQQDVDQEQTFSLSNNHSPHHFLCLSSLELRAFQNPISSSGSPRDKNSPTNFQGRLVRQKQPDSSGRKHPEVKAISARSSTRKPQEDVSDPAGLCLTTASL